MSVRVTVNVANQSTDDRSGTERLVLDGETRLARLAFRRGFAKNWELGADFPYVQHEGGSLDGFIRAYHDTFGFPPSNRKEVPTDRLLYAYLRDARAVLVLPRWGCQVALGGTLLLSGRWSWDVAVAEDAAVSTAPNVVFHLACRRDFL